MMLEQSSVSDGGCVRLYATTVFLSSVMPQMAALLTKWFMGVLRKAGSFGLYPGEI